MSIFSTLIQVLVRPKVFVVETTDSLFFKIMRFISEKIFRRKVIVIGTHDGIFHLDEVVACAMIYLYQAAGFNQIWIVRSRNADILKKCDVCVDVGGGFYDHHTQKKYRPNGKILASAGLVWSLYGPDIVSKIIKKYFSEFSIDMYAASKEFDETVVQLVDYEDNGVQYDKQNPFIYIPAYHPRWDKTTPRDFNRQFKKVLKDTTSILEEQLKDCVSRVYSKAVLLERWSSPEFFQDGILEIPSQTFKWPVPCIEINDSITDESQKINYVIFKHPCGDWAAQCVAEEKKNLFGKRKPFPADWAGLGADRLPEVSGVETATFCHLECFFVRAKTKEDVIKMCKIAMGINA